MVSNNTARDNMARKTPTRRVYGAPRLEYYGTMAELAAGGSGEMQEGSGFIGIVSGGTGAGSMSGPGIGMRDSRP